MPQWSVRPSRVDEVGVRSLCEMYSSLLEHKDYFRKLTVGLSLLPSAKPAAFALKRNSV